MQLSSLESRFLSVRINDGAVGAQSLDPIAQGRVPYYSDILRIDYYDASTNLIRNITTSQSFGDPWKFQHSESIVYGSNILGAVQNDTAFGRMWLCKAAREPVDGVAGDVFIVVWRVRRIVDINRSLTAPYDASPPHLQSAMAFLSAAQPSEAASSPHALSSSKPLPALASTFPYPDSFRSHPIFHSRLENIPEQSSSSLAYSTTIEQGMKELLQRENVKSFQMVLHNLESATRMRLLEMKKRQEEEKNRKIKEESRGGSATSTARWR